MSVTPETRRKRNDCKILNLPPPLRQQVEDKIIEREKYADISDWLEALGFAVSKSAVGAYALSINRAAQRVADDLAKTKTILDYIGRNPDVDAAKAAQALMTSGLMQRMSTAEEEFLELPLDKAMRLIASIRRVDIAEKKLAFDMRSKTELAFAEMEEQLLAAIHHDPVLSGQFHAILIKAKERMAEDE